MPVDIKTYSTDEGIYLAELARAFRDAVPNAMRCISVSVELRDDIILRLIEIADELEDLYQDALGK